MLFGSAIHAAIARYYKGVQKKGKPEPLSLHQDLFHDTGKLRIPESP
jgi:hypothetical protein